MHGILEAVMKGRDLTTTKELPTGELDVLEYRADWERCKCQEESEPSATAKLSQLLAIQTIRTLCPVFADSGESESSHLPSSGCGYDEPVDLRARPSFAHCQKPASIEQRRDLR